MVDGLMVVGKLTMPLSYNEKLRIGNGQRRSLSPFGPATWSHSG